MRRQLRWYGASPLHLLALLACFGLAGYAAARLVSSHPVAVVAWFVGAVIGHDLLLMPLYSLADRSAMAAVRHREPQLPATPWINYLRVPAALSGLLLLVWFPLILRLQSPYHASTTLSADPYRVALARGDGRAVPAVRRRVRGAATPPVANRPAAGTAGHGTRRHRPGSLRPSSRPIGAPQADPEGGEQPAAREDQGPELDAGEGAAGGAVSGHVQRGSLSGPQQEAAGEDPDPPDQIRICLPASSTKHGRAMEMDKQSRPETATNINRAIRFT